MKKLCVYGLLGFGAALGLAQTTEELINDGKNTENVTTESMGFDRKSYSPLKQINKSTVKRLVPVWNTSLMNDEGELAAPTIYNGVMYVVNGKWTFAIDVETGRQIWRTPVRLEPGVQRSAFNRGAATIYNGKVFRVTIDNHVLALDMKTGEQLWNQKFADLKDGYYATGGPFVANGVLISGVAGGESTTRGPRWVGSGYREEIMASIYDSRAGRARVGNMAEEQRCVVAGRRSYVALRLLRSAARSGLLGNGQRGALRSAAS